MMAPRQLVVVGGGIAGVSAAQGARQEYPDAHIILLSAEPYPFYNKIALNTFITGRRRQRHLYFYDVNWLQARRIEARWGTEVKEIRRSEHQVILAEGENLRYDKLIIATGARPALPPIRGIEADRVMPLWSLDDALRIREVLTHSEKVFVLGAGVLGVETALDLAALNKRVILADVQNSILPLHLDEEASQRYQQYLTSSGVEVRLDTSIVEFDSKEDQIRVVGADNSSLKVDAVLLLTGVRPNATLAQTIGLHCEQGIVVDQYLRTSDPDILACGNCIEHQGELRLLWNAAKIQGEFAGLNAFEAKKALSASLPVIHVKSPQMPLFICGRDHNLEKDDLSIIDRQTDNYRKIILDAKGRIKYIIFLGRTSGSWELEKNAQQGVSIPEDCRTVDDVIGVLSDHKPGESRGWVCQMCGYTHESDDPPEICPICAVGKDQFLAA